MPTWLNAQKKARLAELGVICRLGTPEELAEWRKDELVPALESLLSRNPVVFSKDPTFDEYYSRRNSPIKRGGNTRGPSAAAASSSALLPTAIPDPATNGNSSASSSFQDYSASRLSTELPKPEPEPERRSSSVNYTSLSSPTMAAQTAPVRQTKTLVKPTTTPSAAAATTNPLFRTTFNPSASFSGDGALARTPSRLQELLRDEPASSSVAVLPPSPAVVTDMIEAQATRINEELGELLTNNVVNQSLHRVRIEASSNTRVQALFVLVELFYLVAHVTRWYYLFDITNPVFTKSFHGLTLSAYATSYFWSMLLTWLLMSVLVPLTVSWFCNMSLKLKVRNGVEAWKTKYTFDPFVFAMTKGLVAWLVFNHGKRFFGLVADSTIERIEISQPVGSAGILAASCIGITLSVWDTLNGKKGWQ